MNFLQRLMKMPMRNKIWLGVGLVILFWAIFMKDGVTNLSAGGSLHLGNLRASLELEAYENENKPTMCMFYAPWCGHCKKFMPEYDAFMRDINDKENINITKVNGDEHPDLIEKHGVKGFPTIKFFAQGMGSPETAVEYQGPRTKQGLKDFLTKVTGVPDLRVNQSANVDGSVPPINPAGNPAVSTGFVARNFDMS